MPLSKKRNKDRMRQFRLHKRLSPLSQSKDVQPKHIIEEQHDQLKIIEYDADGYPIYED